MFYLVSSTVIGGGVDLSTEDGNEGVYLHCRLGASCFVLWWPAMVELAISVASGVLPESEDLLLGHKSRERRKLEPNGR